ncbi:hypothetical protein AL036_00705 [Salipiger aestuarii]|uniref:hypothetical protein n=1 Tax=Salipiger aestuarii TaxID=568098 RepID=UPI00123B08BD|nr:hypothetical protein [Salipiger aestuarii]KAA8610434.1 hypothetical protein AL036_00705 [Salipiger aestuarii]
MTGWRAPLTLVLCTSFAASPLLTGGFAGFLPTQFPLVQSRWPVLPVGWAFSIWGPVFALLVASAIRGVLRPADDPLWQPMRLPLMLSAGIGTPWIAVAGLQPLMAAVMIVFMAAAAIEALLRAPRQPAALWPVGLYAGWVTSVACIAVAVVLGGYGVIDTQGAALLLLTFLAGLAGAVLWYRPRATAFGLGVGWAYAGVLIANLDIANVPVIALCAAALLMLAAVPLLRPRTRPRLPPPQP